MWTAYFALFGLNEFYIRVMLWPVDRRVLCLESPPAKALWWIETGTAYEENVNGKSASDAVLLEITSYMNRCHHLILHTWYSTIH